MKKYLAALLGFSLLGAPALADPKLAPYSLAAQGCMKLGECTENVFKITDPGILDIIYNNYWTEKQKKELNALIAEIVKLNDKAQLYVADGRYFTSSTRGLYYTDVNKLFINVDYTNNPERFLEVLRHEAWHLAQDCMAGEITNNYIAVIYNNEVIPPKFKVLTEARYGMIAPKAIPWEQEAAWAAVTPYMTVDAMKACNTGSMWEQYPPTPMTREWLTENNYIN
jgi:hypothetical protein